jgi:transposase
MMLQTLKLFVKRHSTNMRFVPVKTAEQQAVLALHRSRQSFIKQRTAQANQIRGLWPNGIVVPGGIAATATITELVEDADNPFPSCFVHS